MRLSKLCHSIQPWHPAILFFIVYALLIINAPPFLTEDEIFFYDQALHLRKLEFINFENTQPLLFPLTLAVTFTWDVVVLRLVSALFASLSLFFLFQIVSERFNQKTAVLSVLMLGVSKFYSQYATTMHTETLFVLTTLLVLKYFFRLQENHLNKNYLLFGFFMGLSMQTKIMGLATPMILSAYLVYYEKKEFLNMKYLSSLILSLLIFLPYFMVGGLKFFIEKTTTSRGVLDEFTFAITQLLPYLSLAFVSLLVLALFFTHLKGENRIFYIYPTIYFLLMLIPETILTTRHFFLILPFLMVIVADFILNVKGKWMRYACSFLLIAFLLSNLRILPETPRLYHQVYYTELPPGCQQLDTWVCGGEEIRIPFFTQPPDSYRTYVSHFNSSDRYNYLIIEYLADRAVDLKLDGISCLDRYEDYPYSRKVVPLSIPQGRHSIEITIYTWQNIGGMGQVLLCKKESLHHGWTFIFPPEEIL